jgi:hypothetical protein
LALSANGEEVAAFQQVASGLLSGPPALYGLYRSDDALGSAEGLRETEVAIAGTALAETEATRIGLERQLTTELRTAAH